MYYIYFLYFYIYFVLLQNIHYVQLIWNRKEACKKLPVCNTIIFLALSSVHKKRLKAGFEKISDVSSKLRSCCSFTTTGVSSLGSWQTFAILFDCDVLRAEDARLVSIVENFEARDLVNFWRLLADDARLVCIGKDYEARVIVDFWRGFTRGLLVLDSFQ